MLPKISHLQPNLPNRGRWCLIGCSLALFALPTWFVTAQTPDVTKPPAEATPPASATVPNLNANPATPPVVEFFPESSTKEQVIIDQLDRSTTMDFTDESLMGVCEAIMERHKFDIVIDRIQLEEESVPVDSADLTLRVSDVTLRSALKLLLRQKGLAFIVEDDVMKITTSTTYQTDMSTRTYPVRDLTGNDADEFLALIEAIRQGVTPGGWKESAFISGPPGADGLATAYSQPPASPSGQRRGTVPNSTLSTISMVPASGCLVIHQSWQGHDEVLKLLRALRKAKNQFPQAPQPAKPMVKSDSRSV